MKGRKEERLMGLRRKLLVSMIIIAAIGLAGCLGLFTVFNPEEIEVKKLRPHIPIEGEETILDIGAADHSSGRRVGGVEITLIDVETNKTYTKYTDADSSTRFKVIVGKTYMITATYGNSTKSITFLAKPFMGIVVDICENQIDDIWIYKGRIN